MLFDLILQRRAPVLNHEPVATFGIWYPDFGANLAELPSLHLLRNLHFSLYTCGAPKFTGEMAVKLVVNHNGDLSDTRGAASRPDDKHLRVRSK